VSPSFSAARKMRENIVRALSPALKRRVANRVLVALAPTDVALLRLEGTLRPRVVEKRVLVCDPVEGAEPWRGAVSSLSAVAAELKNTRARVTVVLSNHFVRYALVPAAERLDRPEEQLAFAQYQFARIHGERSKSWKIRLSTAPAGAARVASAIDSGLLEKIEACFPPDGKARLVSVQPYLMSAFNCWRDAVPASGAWFLLVEPQRSCLALIEDGRWTALRNTRGEFDDLEQWAELLDRERHLAAGAQAPRNVLVHARDSWKVAATEAGGWNFSSLAFAPMGGLTAEDSAPFDLALCAR